jgi:chitodextrinase
MGWRTGLGRAALVLGMMGALGASASAAQAAANTATFTKTSDWGSGFVGNYVIKNNGTTPLVGWKLELTMPLGASLTSAWSGVLGGVAAKPVLTDESWTRTIPAGGSVQVGFQGVASGTFAGPTSCTLNGAPCAGGTPAPDTTAPSVPTGLALDGSVTSTSAKLKWTASTDDTAVAGYRVFRDGVQVAQTTATSATFSDLTPGGTYRFTVRAYDAAGNVSADSAALSVTTPKPDTTAPSVPTGLAVVGTPTQTGAQISWTASSDDTAVVGYRVFRDGTQVAQTSATSATFSDLTADTTYRFTVRAYDAAGNVSADSAALSVTTAKPVVTPPTGKLTAKFTKTDDWGSGFIGSVTISNGGTTSVSGWTLQLQLPAGVAITDTWSAKQGGASTGVVTFTPADWTKTIAAGGSVTFGFQGSASGAFSGPTGCSINGNSCADGGPTPPPDTVAPTAPGNLVASDVAATAVTLNWTAATDDQGVAAYDVYRDGTLVATTTETSTRVRGLQPNTTYALTVKARDAAANVSPASNAVSVTTLREAPTGPGSGATAPGFAPYVDMSLERGVLSKLGSATPFARQATLAFIVDGGGCTPSWGTYYAVNDAAIIGEINAFRASGGTPIIGFGGFANEELANVCPSVDALVKAYQAVMDATGSRDLDFDIEGAAEGNNPGIDRRAEALRRIQADGLAEGRPVRVSFTLPVLRTGLDHNGLNVLTRTLAGGVDIGTVNIMTMNFGSSDPPSIGHMGESTVDAGTSLFDQLRDPKIAPQYGDLSDAQIWKKIGLTPLPGVNDIQAEVFTTADAQMVTAFANQKQIGRLAMWSANRDSPCGGTRNNVQLYCTGTPQTAWQFSTTFGGFPAG